MSVRQRQQGLGLVGLLAALIVIGVVALGVMRILPLYLEHFAVRASLRGVQNDPESETMSPRELRQAIGKRFDVNNVRHFNPAELKIRRDQGRTTLQAEYEIRRSLVANLDIVARFDETVVIESR